MTRFGLSIIAPVTRTRRGYATHIELDGVLPVTGYVQCEQVRAVSAECLIRRVASVDHMDLTRIDTVLRRILAL